MGQNKVEHNIEMGEQLTFSTFFFFPQKYYICHELPSEIIPPAVCIVISATGEVKIIRPQMKF